MECYQASNAFIDIYMCALWPLCLCYTIQSHKTAIHIAAEKGNFTLMDILLTAGVTVKLPGEVSLWLCYSNRLFVLISASLPCSIKSLNQITQRL